jgi:hypothetical protein
MAYWCCLCSPDEIREGRIRNGGGLPLCAEHRALTYWRSRQPQPPCTIAGPEQAYLHAIGMAALAPIAATG